MIENQNMSFIYQNRPIIEDDENALLDISDFTLTNNDILIEHSPQQFTQLMGKSGKRKHSLTSSSERSLTTGSTDIDDDSGFCGSNLSPTINKMVRFDEEILLLKALMKEVNEPLMETTIHSTNTNVNKAVSYQSKSKNGKFELKILSQPEEQHRARYLTEGSRGAIKDKNGLSHPIVKLCGYNKGPVKVQCFIGHDKQIGSPHLFYQASKITGKNSTRCTTKKIDGTTFIVMDACPENDMQVIVDCVGILKERNVDVEQKLIRFKNRADSEGCVTVPTKKRSTRCRLVFRCQIPDTNEILQVVSSPILCTQPLGTPEICKKSLSQCDAKGGQELFIIGKNFLKDAKVIWKNANWTKIVEPDKEFLHSTHLICVIPCYDGPDLETQSSVEVSLTIKSGGKLSDAHKFTYINFERVNAMTLINGTALNTTRSQLLVSNLEKPIVLTMIGSAALSNTINSIQSSQVVNRIIDESDSQSNLTPIQTNQLNSITADTLCYTNTNSDQESVFSVISEDTRIDSSLLTTTTIQSDSQLNQTFNQISRIEFDNASQGSETNTINNDVNDFKTESLIVTSTSDIMPQPVSLPETQYLPLNSFNSIPSSSDSIILNSSLEPVVSSSSLTDIPQMPIACDPITNLLEQIPPTELIPTSMSVITSEQGLTLSNSNPIEPKPTVSIEPIPIKSIISANPVLSSAVTAPAPTVTQASNISTLSEMSDAELLCFINPAAFDQM